MKYAYILCSHCAGHVNSVFLCTHGAANSRAGINCKLGSQKKAEFMENIRISKSFY